MLAVSTKYVPVSVFVASSRRLWIDRYYALSATCALFKYAEIKMNARFASRSLRIRYVPVEGTLMIDPDTVRNLELVASLTHKKSTHSLFGYVFLFSHYVPSEVTNEGCSTILILQWRPASCELISYRPSLVSRSYRQPFSCLKRAASVQDAINARLDFVEGIYGSACFLSLLTQSHSRVNTLRGQVHRYPRRFEGVQEDGFRQISGFGEYRLSPDVANTDVRISLPCLKLALSVRESQPRRVSRRCLTCAPQSRVYLSWRRRFRADTVISCRSCITCSLMTD